MNDIGAASVLALLSVLAVAALVSDAAADSLKAVVTNAPGSSYPGCEETDECFVPHAVTIDAGGQVTWVNADTVVHTITSGTALDGADGVFDSGLVGPGLEFTRVFTEAGDYPYFCIVHPWMSGLVVVQGAMAEETGKDPHAGDAGEISHMMVLSDGTGVVINATAPAAGESMRIDVMFEDAQHTNYDITAVQGGVVVLDVAGAHEHAGMGTHATGELASDEYVDVTITFWGYGVTDITGPQGEKLAFTLVSGVSMPEYGMHDVSGRTFGVITASGSAAIALDANRLNMELGVSTVRDTAAQALGDNSEQMRHVTDAITSLGIPEDDLSTAHLNLYPEYGNQYDAETGDYTQELIGYVVNNMLRIDTDQIYKAADIIDGAVSAGANRIDDVRFGVSPDKEYEARNGLIGAAVDNAQHKAMLAVSFLDYHIVGVKSVVIVDAGTLLQDGTRLAFAQASSAPPVSAGSQHLGVSVTVTFHIQR